MMASGWHYAFKFRPVEMHTSSKLWRRKRCPLRTSWQSKRIPWIRGKQWQRRTIRLRRHNIAYKSYWFRRGLLNSRLFDISTKIFEPPIWMTMTFRWRFLSAENSRFWGHSDPERNGVHWWSELSDTALCCKMNKYTDC